MNIGNYYSAYTANVGATLPQKLPLAGAGGIFNLSPNTDIKQITSSASSPPASAPASLFSSSTFSVLLQGNEVDESDATEATEEPMTVSATEKEADDLMSQLTSQLEDSTPEDMLSEITSMNGYMKWQIKEMTKKATAEVMGKLGVTVDDIQAMPSEQKLAILKMIQQMVQEKIKLAMEEQMKQKNGNELLTFGNTDLTDELVSNI